MENKLNSGAPLYNSWTSRADRVIDSTFGTIKVLELWKASDNYLLKKHLYFPQGTSITSAYIKRTISFLQIHTQTASVG